MAASAKDGRRHGAALAVVAFVVLATVAAVVVAGATPVAMFRTAPSVDYQQFRDDLDDVASQHTTPRG